MRTVRVVLPRMESHASSYLRNAAELFLVRVHALTHPGVMGNTKHFDPDASPYRQMVLEGIHSQFPFGSESFLALSIAKGEPGTKCSTLKP